MITSAIHKLALMGYWSAYRRFKAALRNPRLAQEEILAQLIRRQEASFAGQKALQGRRLKNYQEFAAALPVTRYIDWLPWIELQKSQISKPILSPNCERFEPTSGSTDTRKWIPYSKELLAEFDRAASPWLFDLSISYPGILKGRHYWSLSWLPNELRQKISSSNDVELFPKWKRILLQQMMAVPKDLATVPTIEDSVLATLCHLVSCRDLSLISVWSPTFALELLRDLSSRKIEIAKILRSGSWSLSNIKAPQSIESAEFLESWSGDLDPQFFRKLWPNLALLSCWDSATSAPWAQQLRSLFPGIPLQGKGLWATEGVVTIPFQNEFPAAITSHFLEFRCINTNRILPVWELEKSQHVQPILSTGSGFLRYALEDEMEVVAVLENTPCLKFIGRRNGVDLVGEKMDTVSAGEILDQLTKIWKMPCVSLLARVSELEIRPKYVLLVEGNCQNVQVLAAQLEELLLKFHHYRLARELGQLESAEVLVRTDAIQYYHQLRGANSIAGGRKVEALTLWKASASNP